MDSMNLIGSNVCFKNTQGNKYTCLFSFEKLVDLFGEKMKPDDISFYMGRGFVETDLIIIKTGMNTYIHVFYEYCDIPSYKFTIQSNEKLQSLIDFLPTLPQKSLFEQSWDYQY